MTKRERIAVRVAKSVQAVGDERDPWSGAAPDTPEAAHQELVDVHSGREWQVGEEPFTGAPATYWLADLDELYSPQAEKAFQPGKTHAIVRSDGAIWDLNQRNIDALESGTEPTGR